MFAIFENIFNLLKRMFTIEKGYHKGLLVMLILFNIGLCKGLYALVSLNFVSRKLGTLSYIDLKWFEQQKLSEGQRYFLFQSTSCT